MATFHPIEDVVDVIISLGDRPINQRSFDLPLILTAHNVWTERARVYSAADDLLNDGFAAGSNVYKMAQDMFGGDFGPKQVIVGRRALTNYTLTFDVANDTVYTVNLQVDTGAAKFTKAISFTSDADATAAEISAGLATNIEADGDIAAFVVADGLTTPGTLTIAPDSTGLVSVGAGTDNMVVQYASSETVDTALAAIKQENNNWFFLASDSHTETDIDNLAAYAEANKVIYVGSSAESDIYTSSTTDLLSDLFNLQYDNTHMQISKLADKEFPEGAVIGAWAGTNPGVSTLFAKTLPGVSIQDFTTTEVGFVKGKNGNVYINRGGLGFYEEGKMVSGRFSDVIRGSLWLEARMEEDVFGLLKRKSDLGQKIPYTDSGIAMITSTMAKRLDEAVQRGFLANYTISPPFVADIPTNDRANRTVPDIPFTATLAGAAHKITIRGYVSV